MVTNVEPGLEPPMLVLTAELETALAEAPTLADREFKNPRLAAKVAARVAELERKYELKKRS